jgi:hypothetical protein
MSGMVFVSWDRDRPFFEIYSICHNYVPFAPKYGYPFYRERYFGTYSGYIEYLMKPLEFFFRVLNKFSNDVPDGHYLARKTHRLSGH